jgi:hypothetical protein
MARGGTARIIHDGPHAGGIRANFMMGKDTNSFVNPVENMFNL